MAIIKKQKNTIIIEFDFWEKVWGLKKGFEIKTDTILKVHTNVPVTKFFEMRFPGTFFPYLIKAGSYFTGRGREFWYRTKWKNHCVVIEMSEGGYVRLIIGFKTEKERKKFLKILSKKNLSSK